MDALLYNTLPLVVKSIIIHGAIGYEQKNKKEEISEDDKIFSISATMTAYQSEKLFNPGQPPSFWKQVYHHLYLNQIYTLIGKKECPL